MADADPPPTYGVPSLAEDHVTFHMIGFGYDGNSAMAA